MLKSATDRLLTAKAVAELLSLSKRQIFRLKSSAKLPASVKLGGAVRWRQSELEEWISLGCPDRKTFEMMRGNA